MSGVVDVLRRLGASIRFALVAAGQNFRRNLAVSMAGVFTMGLILVLVGGALLLTHSINQLLDQQQQNSSKIRIYLQDSLSLATISNYESSLSKDPRVLSVGFTSKDQAVIDSKNRGLDFTTAIGTIGTNPLPASIDLNVRQLSDLGQLDSLAKTLPIVDQTKGHETDYNSDVIPRLQSLIFYIQLAGLILALILAAISLVIIMNTIRTAVYIRRTEIEIMKLVGATDWFVRWPFILEGVLGGILAAVFSGAIVAIAYNVLLTRANTAFFGGLYDGGYLAVLLTGLLVGGAGLGAFGSYLGVRRFLNV